MMDIIQNVAILVLAVALFWTNKSIRLNTESILHILNILETRHGN